MSLRPTQGDENVSVQLLPFMEPTPYPLSSRAKPRDLQFRGPFLEMFFDRAEWRDLWFLLSSRGLFSARCG
jgi:hypothetical protein